MQIIYGYTHPHPANDYCIYCDSDAIKDEAYDNACEMAKEYLEKHPDADVCSDDFIDECEEKLFNEYTVCRSCYNED